MKTTAAAVRRCLGGVFAASAIGGAIVTAMALPGAPAAGAANDPCAASEVARTIGGVATSMGNYLDAHPDTNTALTTISQQQGGPQSVVALKSYFDANPQASKDMQALESPLQGLSARCKLPFTLPQVMGLFQGAQTPFGSLPGVTTGGLPNSLSTAQSAGAGGPLLPAEAVPAAAAAPGSGSIPGPATTVAPATR